MEIRAQLLGPPRLHFEGETVWPPYGKTAALLYHLAHEAAWVGRDTYLYLLYPDNDESSGRRNLRRLLASVRDLPYTRDLETEGDRLRWLIRSDVSDLREALQREDFEAAVEANPSPLLEAFVLPGAPDYEEWLREARMSLHRRWLEAAFRLVEEHRSAGRGREAADVLESIARAESEDEEILRRLLRSLQELGEPRRAHALYEAFARRLERDIGVEPDETTRVLAAEIAAAESTSGNAWGGGPGKSALSVPPTPFFGRVAELERIVDLIAQRGARLVTLTGPGGSGKTRLALEAAHRLTARFADGARFVSLAPVTDTAGVATAVAEAIGAELSGSKPLVDQLRAALADRSVLLVADNFEHLLSLPTPPTDLLADLMERVPGLAFLVTSRERLHLRGEHVVSIGGLSWAVGARQSAMELFVASAKRHRPEFSPGPDERERVLDVCEMLGGMPLALELAAAWLRVLPLDRIVTELESGMDLLRGRARDAPERHRSVRAAFDASWELLDEGHRRAVRQLSVFPSSFDLDAAIAVADADLMLLTELADRSLLEVDRHGRYRFHPLLWQYAKEKMARDPDEARAASLRHTDHYLRVAPKLHLPLDPAMSAELHRRMALERPNLREAWSRAVERGDHDRIERLAEPLVFAFRNSASEGIALMDQTLARLGDPASDPVIFAYALLLRWEVSMWVGAGRPVAMLTDAARAQDLLQDASNPWPRLQALFLGGIGRWLLGDFDDARTDWTEGTELAQAARRPRKEVRFRAFLAQLERQFSDDEEVRAAFEASVHDLREVGDAEALSWLLHFYGSFLTYRDPPRGRSLLMEGVEIRENSDLPSDLNSWADLAHVSLRLGQYERAEGEARYLLERSREYGFLFFEAQAHVVLGRTATALEHPEEARRELRRALGLASRLDVRLLAGHALIAVADLRLAEGRREDAESLLSEVERFPWLERHDRIEAAELRMALRDATTPEAGASSPGPQPDLHTDDSPDVWSIVRSVLADLNRSEPS